MLEILIAEDEFLCLTGLINDLEELGHKIIGEAANGIELVEMAENLNPDLIITDINMPLLNGIEAIKKINTKKEIPSIVISGYSDEKLVKNAIELGIYSYIVKPFEKRDLKIAIDLAIARYEDYKKVKNELEKTKTDLENRKIIEKAKGLLMEHKNLTEREAFKKMQKMSKDKNRKLILIAEDIIKAFNILN
ncbi:MAG: two-component system, response regulator PdtaR [Fusobacteriaceae bacterium]|nr:response regulator [Fusobacteriales bacterium]MDN5303607.1 two-component system, response regulator PdtaR [Fusobacteriaceae bacterium]